MGLYYSSDNRYCTSTHDCPPSTYLTLKGIQDTNAAIIIQRWWRRMNKQTSHLHSDNDNDNDNESYMADNSDNSVECVRRRSYKRKLDEITDLDIEEINTSEFYLSDSDSDSDVIEQELQTIGYNSFLWDFFYGLFSFVWKLFSY